MTVVTLSQDCPFVTVDGQRQYGKKGQRVDIRPSYLDLIRGKYVENIAEEEIQEEEIQEEEIQKEEIQEEEIQEEEIQEEEIQEEAPKKNKNNRK